MKDDAHARKQFTDICVQPRRGFYALTDIRIYRLQRCVRLTDAASRAGINAYRASLIERDPGSARAGEIEALHRAVDEIAAERNDDPEAA